MSDVYEEVVGQLERGGKTLITSKGIALQIVGISPLLIAKLQSVGTLPTVPTRKVPLDFGEGDEAFQEEPIKEDEIQNDEEQAAWDAYKAARDVVLAKRNNGFMKAVFAKGVNVDLSRIEEWKRDMEYFDIDIPTHPLDLKVEFIQTEAIGNTDDMVDIITGVLGESGLPEEELANVRTMFRNSVRRRTTRTTVDSEGTVEVEPDVYGNESGEVLERVASIGFLPGE